MSGLTTKNVKFIKPLEEKLTYTDSINRCDSWGFRACSLNVYREKWHQAFNSLMVVNDIVNLWLKTWTTDASGPKRRWTKIRQFTCCL